MACTAEGRRQPYIMADTAARTHMGTKRKRRGSIAVLLLVMFFSRGRAQPCAAGEKAAAGGGCTPCAQNEVCETLQLALPSWARVAAGGSAPVVRPVAGTAAHSYMAFVDSATATTLNVSVATTVEILAVAGGGAGAWAGIDAVTQNDGGGGGGGAGGLFYATNVTLQAGTYIISVGRGGRPENAGFTCSANATDVSSEPGRDTTVLHVDSGEMLVVKGGGGAYRAKCDPFTYNDGTGSTDAYIYDYPAAPAGGSGGGGSSPNWVWSSSISRGGTSPGNYCYTPSVGDDKGPLSGNSNVSSDLLGGLWQAAMQ